MEKIILISYGTPIDNSQLSVLKDRIKGISGDFYNYFTNNWLVRTEIGPVEVYKKIIANNEYLAKISILVIEVEPSYYGRMNTALWEWLQK